MTIEEILKDPGELGAAARQFVETAAKFMELASRNDLVLAALIATQDQKDDPFKRDKSYKPFTRDEIALAGQEMGKALAGDNMVAGIKGAAKVFLLLGGI